MSEISVILRTGGHCIQTSARNELRRITDILLRSESEHADPVFAEQIELLTDFLKTEDFNRLRSSDSRFAGLEEGVFNLRRNGKGKIEVVSI